MVLPAPTLYETGSRDWLRRARCPGSGVTEYWLVVGTSQGVRDVFNKSSGTSRTATVSDLPLNGNPLFVELWWQTATGWSSTSYSYQTQNRGGGDSNIDIIIDNQDANVTQTGSWSTSSGPNPWAGNSVYGQGGGTTFRWTPQLPAAGTFQVYAWWTYHKNRSTSVPYRIQHGSGTSTVTVNQGDAGLGGQWNLLGTYTVNAGSGGYVEVLGFNGQASADWK